MYYYNQAVFYFLVLTSATILPAQSTTLVEPLVQHSTVQRKSGCAKVCAFLTFAGILTAGCFGIESLRHTDTRPTPTEFPTLAPRPYQENRFHVSVRGICSPACPDLVDRQEMCIPAWPEEWNVIQEQVQTICPNSTDIRLSICSTSSETPYPPCLAVNATLQELSDTCSPHDKNSRAASTLVGIDAIRNRFRASQKKRAQLRKPAHLRD